MTASKPTPYIPDYKPPTSSFASSIVISLVMGLSKLIFRLQNPTVYNRERFQELAVSRPKGRPLISVANHSSCLDDPTLFALLPWKAVLRPRECVRWSLAAREIIFTSDLFTYFFTLGQTIPIVRGDGIYQPGMDHAIDRLNRGEWVHVFPEGKVNQLRTMLRFKWGIGRLVLESKEAPIVLPFWHRGMEQVLPEPECPQEPPHPAPILPHEVPTHDHGFFYHLIPSSRAPRFNKHVTVAIGEPIDTAPWREEMKGWDEVKARTEITRRIMAAMEDIKKEVERKDEEMRLKLLNGNGNGNGISKDNGHAANGKVKSPE